MKTDPDDHFVCFWNLMRNKIRKKEKPSQGETVLPVLTVPLAVHGSMSPPQQKHANERFRSTKINITTEYKNITATEETTREGSSSLGGRTRRKEKRICFSTATSPILTDLRQDWGK